MNLRLLRRAARDYELLSRDLQARVDIQFSFLLDDLHHPSLRAHKRRGSRDVWQGRVTDDYRFLFKTEDDTYTILTIIKHPK